MKTFTRRKFLKNVLCGVGLAILGTRTSMLFAHSSTESSSRNQASDDLLQLFGQARKLFSQKRFAESEALYRQMLDSLPAHISVYDCFKNLLAWESRTDEIIPYYKSAIEKYPSRVDFYDRLAKTYREIAAGNKKMEQQVCRLEGRDDLIETAIGWYNRAIQQDPGKKFLYFGLLDTLCARSRSKNKKAASKGRSAFPAGGLPEMDDLQRRLTEPYIREWLDRKNPVEAESAGKMRVIASYPVQIQRQIEKITDKTRKTLYDPLDIESRAREMKLAIKRLNMKLHAYYIREKKWEELTTHTLSMLRDNPEETSVLGIAKKNLQKYIRPDLELHLYTERVKWYDDFWTKAGLAKAYLHDGDIVRAKESIERLPAGGILRVGKKVDLIHRGLCDCAVAVGDYATGKESLLKGIAATSGIGGIATSLLFKYAECLCLENKNQQAVELLRKRLDPNQASNVADPVLKYIAPDMGTSTELYYLHQFHNRQKAMHTEEKVSIWCAIAKIRRKAGDKSGLDQACREIEVLIPSHPFVRKIQSSS